jgi:hypothetical protein
MNDRTRTLEERVASLEALVALMAEMLEWQDWHAGGHVRLLFGARKRFATPEIDALATEHEGYTRADQDQRRRKVHAEMRANGTYPVWVDAESA